MPTPLQGGAQDLEISFDSGSTYLTLVCLKTGSVDNEVDTTEEKTNCGPILVIGDMNAKASFDAICEVSPTVSQCTYGDMLEAMSAKTLLKVRYQNPVVTGASTGAVFYQNFDAYVISLSSPFGEGEGFVRFSGELGSTGVIDIVA